MPNFRDQDFIKKVYMLLQHPSWHQALRAIFYHVIDSMKSGKLLYFLALVEAFCKRECKDREAYRSLKTCIVQVQNYEQKTRRSEKRKALLGQEREREKKQEREATDVRNLPFLRQNSTSK